MIIAISFWEFQRVSVSEEGRHTTMKSEAVTRKNDVSIHEIGIDELIKEMSEWSDRIAKRAYELFATSGFTNGHDREDWFKAESELLEPVAVEVKDSDSQLVVKAAVPGFAAKDLDLHMSGSYLIIEGKHETTEEKKIKEGKSTEHKSEQIYRTIELPAPVLTENAHAELKNGVLELTLPKAEKAKQIKIAAA